MSSSDKDARRRLSRRLPYGGLLLCLALIFSYLEALLPLPMPPGCKPGFANLVTAFCAYVLGLRTALCLSVLRVLLSALLFGSASSFLYSLTGAIFSFAVLAVLLKGFGRALTPVSVSAACAAAHNAGQLCMAALLLHSAAVFTILPWMLLAGILTGTVTGLLLWILLPRLPKSASEILEMRLK